MKLIIIIANILVIHFALISLSSTLNIPNEEQLELDDEDIYAGVENAVTLTSSLVPFNSSFDISKEKFPRFQFRQRSNNYCAPELIEAVEESPEEPECPEPPTCTLETLSPNDLFKQSLQRLLQSDLSPGDLSQRISFLQGVIKTIESGIQRARDENYIIWHPRPPVESTVVNAPVPVVARTYINPDQEFQNNYYNALRAANAQTNMIKPKTGSFDRQNSRRYTPSNIQSQNPQTYSYERSYTSPDGSYSSNSYNYHSYSSQTYGTST